VQEHVLLGRPFFMLHPCQTEAVMQLLQRGAEVSASEPPSLPGTGPAAAAGPAEQQASLQYLLAWLSAAGQPLGLDVPAALWLTATQQGMRE
jgi:hypothetical protein